MAISGKGWLGVSLLVTTSFAVLAAIVGMTAGVSAARGDAPAQKSACPADNGGLTLSPSFAQRYLPTISAMSATSSWRRTARSTPTRGAAATFPMRPRRRAVFS